MKNLLLASVFLVFTVSESMIIPRANTSNPSNSTDPNICEHLSKELLDPEYGDSFWSVDYQLHDSTCQANVRKSYQVSTTCLSIDLGLCDFQQIPFDSLASRCCTNECQMFSYIIRWCSACPPTYVRLILQEGETFKEKCVPRRTPTHGNKPIAARITIDSKNEPREEAVKSVFRKWKKESRADFFFSDLEYSTKEKSKGRYLIIYRFKNAFSH